MVTSRPGLDALLGQFLDHDELTADAWTEIADTVEQGLEDPFMAWVNEMFLFILDDAVEHYVTDGNALARIRDKIVEAVR